MGLLSLLTLTFVLLKTFSVIDWSWWLVFIPAYLMVIFSGISIVLLFTAKRRFDKEFDDFKF